VRACVRACVRAWGAGAVPVLGAHNSRTHRDEEVHTIHPAQLTQPPTPLN
jgi:hypothetical protein